MGEAAHGRGRGGLVAWLAPRSMFFINGLVFSSWFVRVASVKSALRLKDDVLGVALAASTVGSVIAMQFTGRLVTRFGDRATVCWSAVLFPLTFLLVSACRDVGELIAALAVFGAAVGMLDVAMNAEAIAVERAGDSPVLNSCHASWSIGSIVGSATAGWAVAAHLTFSQHAVLLTAFVVLLVAIFGRGLVGGDRTRADSAQGPVPAGDAVPRWKQGWTAKVLLLGSLGAFCMLCEGSVGDWSGVFLQSDRSALPGVAALGYICFSATETSGRLVGDRLHVRFGSARLVRVGSAFGAACLVLIISVPFTAVSILGFALLGAGLSVIVPVILGAVGHTGAEQDGHAVIALSRFSTLTYTSFLLGPPLIGWVGSVLGLSAALVLLAVPLVWVAVKAPAVAGAGRTRSADGGGESRRDRRAACERFRPLTSGEGSE